MRTRTPSVAVPGHPREDLGDRVEPGHREHHDEQPAETPVWVSDATCGEPWPGVAATARGRQDAGVRRGRTSSAPARCGRRGSRRTGWSRAGSARCARRPGRASSSVVGDDDAARVRPGLASTDGLVAPGATRWPSSTPRRRPPMMHEREVGGARDRALRVAGLVAEHRGGLEADEARDREHDRDAHRAGEDLAGGSNAAVERPSGPPPATITTTSSTTTIAISASSSTPRTRLESSMWR